MTFGLSRRCAVDGVRSETVMGVPGGEERPAGVQSRLCRPSGHTRRDGHLTEARRS
jgi:hypothetical protein